MSAGQTREYLILLLALVSLIISVVGVFSSSETLNGVVIVCCSIFNIVSMVLIFYESLSCIKYGLLINLLGIFFAFWLQAILYVNSDYKIYSFDISSQVGNHWRSETVSIAILFVTIFQASCVYGYLCGFIPNRVVLFLKREDKPSKYVHCFVSSIFIIFMLFALFLKYDKNLVSVYNGLIRSRANEEFVNVGLLVNFVYIGYYGIAFLVVSYILEERKSRIFMFLPIALLGLLVVLLDGTRHHQLYLLIPIIMLFIYLGRNKKKYVAALFCIFVIFSIVYQGQSKFRYSGWNNFKLNTELFESFQGTDQFEVLVFVVETIPDRRGYTFTPAFPYFFTHWIPRSVWPNKTHQPELEYISSEVTGVDDITIRNATPSIIGQYYMKCGVLGIAWIGLFLGWLFKSVDLLYKNITLNTNIHLWILLGMFEAFLVNSFRFYGPQYLIYVMYAFVIYYLSTESCIKRHKTRV